MNVKTGYCFIFQFYIFLLTPCQSRIISVVLPSLVSSFFGYVLYSFYCQLLEPLLSTAYHRQIGFEWGKKLLRYWSAIAIAISSVTGIVTTAISNLSQKWIKQLLLGLNRYFDASLDDFLRFPIHCKCLSYQMLITD